MRPRLLDLFCGAGGAAMGYHRAGFDVMGVDINPQPNYPFDFHQVDVTVQFDDGIYEAGYGEFDAIHASPPCQAYTTMSNRHRGAGGAADDHDELIDATRSLLERSGLPWVIENVVGATRAMRSPVTLHGGMFGLDVYRPRLFESNVLLLAPQGHWPKPANPIGVYGKLDGRRLWTRADGSELRNARTLDEGRAAMGVDWMEWRELAESIPPAYTEWIGAQLLAAIPVSA